MCGSIEMFNIFSSDILATYLSCKDWRPRNIFHFLITMIFSQPISPIHTMFVADKSSRFSSVRWEADECATFSPPEILAT